MKRSIWICTILAIALSAAVAAGQGRLVRVGVFEAAPLVFREDGQVTGFYPDILNAVAEREGWRLQYVAGTWEEHRPGVEDGTIDLLPGIAYTAAREEILDFTEESFLTVWNQVYMRKGARIRHVLDLEGLTVGLLAGDINRPYLEDLVSEFGASCTIFELPTQEDIFAAIASGEVDVGVATNVFGYLNTTGYDLVASPIVFAPFSIRIATAQGRNADLLAAIDAALLEWQQSEDSLYFRRLNHWFGGGRYGPAGLPQWVLVALAIVVGIALLLVFWVRLLNHQVRRQTRTLQRSEQRFRQLFESAGDGIFILDGERIIDCNARSLELYGRRRDEIIGRRPDQISPRSQPDGEDSRALAEARIAAAFDGRTEAFAWRHARPDGSEFDVEVTLTSFEHDGAQFLQAIVRDVTERRQLETDLRQAQKMEAIGTLAGGIAHDFNNILSAILGYGELARMDAADHPELLTSIEQVLRAGERARDLVQQILAFSRRTMEARRPVEIAPIVQETLQLLRSSIPSTIEITQDLRSRGLVLADPTAIYQVLMNLCTNAYQAMADEGGELRVVLLEVEGSARGEVPPGNHVMIEVRDTGPGMDAATTAKIFEPYFTTKGAERGTGLGLAVVHGIVTEHGGSIAVESEVGRGSVFRILLPLCERPAGDPAGDPTAEAVGGSERVLLVDDERDIVDYCATGLERLGYEVMTFTRPSEALVEFTRDPAGFDILVTDMTMPGMTGLDLATAAMRLRADLPVVLCTGYSDRVSGEVARGVGVTSFLMKPLVVSRLAVEIRAALNVPSAQLPPRAT